MNNLQKTCPLFSTVAMIYFKPPPYSDTILFIYFSLMTKRKWSPGNLHSLEISLNSFFLILYVIIFFKLYFGVAFLCLSQTHVGTHTHYIHLKRTSMEDHSSRFTPFFPADANHFNRILASGSEAFKAVRSVNTQLSQSHLWVSHVAISSKKVLICRCHSSLIKLQSFVYWLIRVGLTCAPHEKWSALDRMFCFWLTGWVCSPLPWPYSNKCIWMMWFYWQEKPPLGWELG